MSDEEFSEKSPEEQRRINKQIASYQRFKKQKRIIWLTILVVLLAGAFTVYKLNVTPPETDGGGIIIPTPSSDPTDNPGDTDVPTNTGGEDKNSDSLRKEGVYTFLIVGNDNGYGNTDTIMVGMLDTKAEKLNILSIPRDTMVNVSWAAKKVNTILAMSDMDGLMSGISAIMGYEIDKYAIVDLDAFVELVDAVDGVDFNVPVDMKYSAYDQNPPLIIDVDAGYQHLDGPKAIQVMRFRDYADADIGRINTQQAFLTALAKKCMSLGNLFKVNQFAEIFKEYVDTDLTTGNIIWYAQKILGMDADDINFFKLPENYNDSVKGWSYCSIYIDEWLEMLNESFNPWNVEITEDNLNILTRDEDGNLYATTGVIAGGIDSFYDHNAYLASLRSASSSGPTTETDTEVPDTSSDTTDETPQRTGETPDATDPVETANTGDEGAGGTNTPQP